MADSNCEGWYIHQDFQLNRGLDVYFNIKYGVVVLASAVLAACGGGGGGSAGGGSSLVSFMPSRVSATVYKNEKAIYQVIATPGAAMDGNVYVVVNAPHAIFDSNIDIRSALFVDTSSAAEGKYVVSLYTKPLATAGTYNGNLSIAFCKTEDCSQQYPGSPVNYPYSITVKDMVKNTKTMASIDGLNDWVTYHGDYSRKGFVAADFDPANFSERWSWASGNMQESPSPVVADSATVYFAVQSYEGNARFLAINAADGSQKWEYIRPPSYIYTYFGDPVLADGTLYSFIAPFSSGDSPILSIDKSTGAVSTALPTYSFNTGSKLSAVADNLYATTWGAGGIRYSVSGTWQADMPYSTLYPAFSDGNVIGTAGADLRVADQLTGNTLSNVHIDGFYAFGATILADSNSVLVRGDAADLPNPLQKMHLIDLQAENVSWSVPGRFFSDAVTDGSRWYAVNQEDHNALEAHRLSDGGLLWTWPMPMLSVNEEPNLLLSNNLVFVSNGLATFAINRETGVQVWSYPRGGDLAISPTGIL